MVWNPDRNCFVIPYLNHPVTWYGFLFAMSFLLGYFLIRKILTYFLRSPGSKSEDDELKAIHLADQITIAVAIGGIVGARFGHIFFYDWPFYRSHPTHIFKIWEGGLASHGGAIGALVALFIYWGFALKKIPRFNFIALLDMVVIPTMLAGSFIRIGNFINQEITGIPTTQFWGVIFLRPIDGIAGVPLHPVQLYEAAFYFFVFALLFTLWWREKQIIGKGLLSGLFFLLVFGFRFFIEYLKMPQNETIDLQSWLRMGQWLSIPFILVGFFLLIKVYVKQK